MNPFKDIALYIIASLAALSLGLAGWLYVSKAHVQTEFAQYKAAVATQTAKAESKARDREHELNQTNQRLTDELSQKDRILAARDAAARRSDAGLRDEITRLNARPAPENPQARAFSDEASTARELLGACSDEYRGMALKADELRDQVIGLQEYIQNIVQPGQ